MSLSPAVDKFVHNVPSPIWETLKSHLRSKVSPINYNNWFKPISNVRQDGPILIISVPNKFIADWITDYYVELIKKEAASVVDGDITVQFEITAEENVDKKSGSIDPFGRFSSPLRKSPSPSSQTKYDFDNFVVGSGNQLAHAAAKSVAEFPGGHYNPLFLYGGVGLGKTHLLNAIGIEISRRYPGTRIIYIASEKFMNEFINSVRHDKMRDFRKKYRESCDILLIDDIQFLGGKESTQDEFFHTFNTLHDAKRQIVVSSDKVPREIHGLEERLRSRFEWGLIADIQAPDFETRVAILKKKGEKDGIYLTNDVALYLAQEVKSNVRELEGALIRLNAFAKLKESDITLDLTKEILKSILPVKYSSSRGCTIESIQQTVADYYQIKLNDLKSERRTKCLAYPRQVAMYLCKKHLKASFPEIGNKFGGKDHTTVMHAFRKIEKLTQEDGNLQNDLAILEKTILH